MANEQAIEKAPAAKVHPAVQVSHWLNKRSDKLAEWCTESIDPVTLIRIGSRLVSKQAQFQDPKTWPSLYMALITAAQLGLEPDGPRGEAYLIPYWDRDAQCNLVQLMPGYRGLMKLVMNSEDVDRIRSQVVYANEPFAIDHMDPDDPEKNYHRPIFGDRGDPVGVYSRVKYADGSYDNEVASWDEVMLAKAQAKGKSPAWETWPEQMARKFIIKRHANQLPLDGRTRQAIAIDNIQSDSAAADARAVIDVDNKLEGAPEPAALAAAPVAAAAVPESGLASKLAAKAEARKAAAPAMSKTLPAKSAKAAAEAAKKAKASKPEPEEEPPLPPDPEDAGEDFNQCGLCGDPTPDEICGACHEANEAS